MQTAKKIVIVGGGIGGAATALALHHAGFDVIVYERTPELREVGAGVALWANATHVLKNLGFGFVMIGKKRMYWYVAAKAIEGQPDAAIGRKKELQLMFQDWCEPIPELIAATDEANILRNDLYDRVPTQPWSQQNITLLGDAAHPTLPTLGQGACMALEDAIAVTKCLLAFDTKAAFEQYELQRFARTKMIVEESLQAAKLGQWENPAAVALREIFMKLLPTAVLKNKVNALQAYRV